MTNFNRELPFLDPNSKSSGKADSIICCFTECEPQDHKITVDVHNGQVRLWAKDKKLNWKWGFSREFGSTDKNKIMETLRQDINAVMVMWDDAAPIKLEESNENPHFEILVSHKICLSDENCYYATAFFPSDDMNLRKLKISKQFIEQSDEMRRRILAHEVGHIFGLRHSNAKKEEVDASIQLHEPEVDSIMGDSVSARVTAKDKQHLRELYAKAWGEGQPVIVGTPIKLVSP